MVYLIFGSCQENKKSTAKEPKKNEVKKLKKHKEKRFESIDYDQAKWSEIKNNMYYQLDIRYATENNFMKQKIYNCGRCFLDVDTKKKLDLVAKDLYKKSYKIILYDCFRPSTYQQKLWDIMPNASYVTPPQKGSMHSRGSAIDLSLITLDNKLIEMGTSYDFFGPKAHYLSDEISETAKLNRKILRESMEKYGFKGIRTEWWHFSNPEKYKPLSDWTWSCTN